jgi:hypothetical protein
MAQHEETNDGDGYATLTQTDAEGSDQRTLDTHQHATHKHKTLSLSLTDSPPYTQVFFCFVLIFGIFYSSFSSLHLSTAATAATTCDPDESC